MKEIKIRNTEIQQMSFSSNANDYYIKRDDLIPFSFGGNKARKAILFFKDIEDKRANCVVTYGSSSSNHCRVVANIAVTMNIPCHIISPNERIENTYNRKLIRLLGAKIHSCKLEEVNETIQHKINELNNGGYLCYFIPGGGHGNIGTQAYVNCYEEICSYEQENNVMFDYIFLASGTGTTQAGLICGKIMHGDKERKIVGISIARGKKYGSEIIKKSAEEFLNNVNPRLQHDDICFVDDYTFGGYGEHNEEVLQTIKYIIRTDGIPLDSTYTGKAFYGMHEYVEKNDIHGKVILFIHTGGLPLFFNNIEELH